MALVIRLRRMGSKNQKKWRIVVTEKKAARDGRFLEELGTYHSLKEPPEIKLQGDRYETWVRQGARPSQVVRFLAKKVKSSPRS